MVNSLNSRFVNLGLCSFKTCPPWSDNLERTDEPGTGGTGGGKDDDDDDRKKDKDRA